MEAKQCVKCGAFDRYPSGRCKPCSQQSTRNWRRSNSVKSRVYTDKWRVNNIDKVKKYGSEYRNRSNDHRIRHTLNQAKLRAKDKGIEFSIVLQDLCPLPSRCPILGIELNYKGNNGARGFIDDSPSIDRVDSSVGYIAGNVKIISWRANRVKSNSTIKELQSVIDYMKDNLYD